MKKITLYIILIISSNLIAIDSHWEAIIIKKILVSIMPKKEISIYSNKSHFTKILKDINNITIVNNCKDADLLLLDGECAEKCDKPEIVFSYSQYQSDQNAVGVFFWQKGRPTIRFSKKHLQKFGLKVQGELTQFVSSKN